jgi:opacity protein-like surface antigen
MRRAATILRGPAIKMTKLQSGDAPMNRLREYRSTSTALLLCALCTLSSALPAYAQQDVHRAVPPAGRALVFVFRVDRDPVAAQVPVVVNREPVGELANGTFVTATVNPGSTELRVGQRLVRTLSFVAIANQTYFVRVEAISGPTLVRIEAHSVSEPEGRRSLAQSRFVGVAPAVVIPPVAAPPAAAVPVAAPAVVPPPAAPAPVAAPAPPVERAVVAEPPAIRPATPDVTVPAKARRESAFALIANAGTFKLANENQTVAGGPSTYDTTSKSVFSVEAEWRSGSGFAVGGEYFTYKNDLVSTAPVPNAQQKVYAIMLNGKYYFHAADWAYPFVGVGAGYANASYSGGLTGNATGLAYQGLAGMEFRFKPVGISVQYRYLSSKTGESGREVKVGGSGVLAGVSISF